jgi:hypothetical protein
MIYVLTETTRTGRLALRRMPNGARFSTNERDAARAASQWSAWCGNLCHAVPARDLPAADAFVASRNFDKAARQE